MYSISGLVSFEILVKLKLNPCGQFFNSVLVLLLEKNRVVIFVPFGITMSPSQLGDGPVCIHFDFGLSK